MVAKKEIKISNLQKNNSTSTKKSPSILLIILAVFGVLSIIPLLIFVLLILVVIGSSSSNLDSGNVAVIPLEGVIMHSSSGFFSDEVASPNKIKAWINDAEADDNIEAIIFAINSPGGTPVATDEISIAIKAAKKPTYALIREVGASGAYWIATATDKIYANRMSVVGSIGVVATYMEFNGLMDDYNVTYRRLVAGKYKDMGTPLKEMTDEEEIIFQKQLDSIHDLFIEEVAINRNLSIEEVEKVAEGLIYIGIEAKELGLIDETGTIETLIEDIEYELDIKVELVEYYTEPSFADILTGSIQTSIQSLGKGVGSSMFEENSIMLQ